MVSQCSRGTAFQPVAPAFGCRRPVLRSRPTPSCRGAADTGCGRQLKLNTSRCCDWSQTVFRAQKQEDQEEALEVVEKAKDIVGGIDINQEGDIWEGELVGIIVKVSMLWQTSQRVLRPVSAVLC